MKIVKALNSGIVTDLGLGSQIYKITMEGIEVEDDVAAKIQQVFGHTVEVTDVGEAVAVEETPNAVETPVVDAPAVEDAPVETAPVETNEDAPLEDAPVDAPAESADEPQA